MLVYGSGRIAIPFISIVTLPILTRFFNPSDYGIIEGIATISSIFGLFSTLMLESATLRSYYDYSESEEFERKRIISTSFWTLVIWNLIFIVPILPNSQRIGSLFFTEGRYGLFLLVSVATIPLISLINFLKEIFRLHNQPLKYSFYSVTNALISATLIIILVVACDFGLIGYFLGPLIGSLFLLPVVFWFVRDNILRILSWDELKKMLHYGLPLIPANCSIWVLTLSDRFFLLKLTSLREVGLYAIGAKLAQLILLFVTAFGLAWSPFILSIYSRDREEEKRVRGRITTYYIFVLAILAVFITSFSRPIILLLATKEFLDAYKVIGFLAMGTAAAGASQALCTGINISRKTKYLAIYTGTAAFLNIFLNAVLVPTLGFMGAAMATAISYLFLCILYYSKSQKLYLSPYEPGKIIKIGVVSLILILVGTTVSSNDMLMELLAKITLFLSFPFLCLVLKVFDGNEICAVKRELSKVFKLR